MFYKFLKLNEKKKIKKFLKCYWKEKHILVKNENLLTWQHVYRKKLNFFCLKKKNKIISSLGIINQSRDPIYKKQGLGIICSRNKFGIIDLMINFLKKNYNILVAIGLTKEIIPIYRKLKFLTGELNAYYICNPNIENNLISKNLIKRKYISKKNNNLKSINIKDLKKFVRTRNFNYLKWRFIEHPIYKYKFLISKNKKIFIIFRDVKIKKYKFMRIVDFFGSFKKQEKFVDDLLGFCVSENYNHIELMHYGYEDRFIKKTIFNKKTKRQKIPFYVEPFDNLKKQNLYFAYKSKLNNKLKIVRADADADRPNIY